METVITSLIQQLGNGNISIVACLGLIFIALFKAGKFFNTIEHIDKKTTYLERKIETIEEKVDMLNVTMAKVQSSVDILCRTHLSSYKGSVGKNS
jgi:hypothetical protein